MPSTINTYADLEVHILPYDGVDSYPIDITLDDEIVYRGQLSADILSWKPTGDRATDGKRLFNVLLADPVLHNAWGEVRGRAPQRHIRLWIDTFARKLHALPWELLQEETMLLAADAATPLSRYLPVPLPWSCAVKARPIRVLAVISNPVDLGEHDNLPPPVDVDTERAILESVLATQSDGITPDELELVFLDAPVTPEKLQEALRGDTEQTPTRGCHVLHFVGHGKFSSQQGQAALYMQDKAGRTRPLLDNDLATMIASLNANVRPKLVTLIACQSATRTTADAFAGLGPKLVAAGVPAVVAMQGAVKVETARTFTATFYRQLLDHGTVDLAMNEARSTLLVAGRPDAAVPVLFMRLTSGQLWEIDREKPFERLPCEPETVLIPGGPFLMGSVPAPGVPERETPRHKVSLPDYRIGKYPVTVRQYAAFINANQDQPTPRGWFNRNPPPSRLDHPITEVSWHDAMTYCAWLSQQTDRAYTLCSEAEWEKAASWTGNRERGAESDRKRRYPWGSEWLDEQCNTAKSGTTAVTAHPTGASAYGVEDLLGNVQEWTRSLWGRQSSQPDFDYPYDPADGREITDPAKLPAQARLVHRGGWFDSAPVDLFCSARGNASPGSKIAWRGFRVTMIIE